VVKAYVYESKDVMKVLNYCRFSVNYDLFYVGFYVTYSDLIKIISFSSWNSCQLPAIKFPHSIEYRLLTNLHQLEISDEQLVRIKGGIKHVRVSDVVIIHEIKPI